MKNYEKYADEIRELESDIGIEWCELFAKPKILKSLGRTCEDVSCGLCSALAMLWLMEDYKEPEVDWSKVEADTPIRLMKEYEEPQVDWSKVEVDTPVLVKDKENEEWKKRHFAKYEFGRVHVWNNGSTSWSACHMYDYKYAKLAESEEE